MKIVRDGLWLCVDCLMAAVNGDVSGIESRERVAAVDTGLSKLGRLLVPDFDSESGDGCEEFMRAPLGGCACCSSTLAGTFHRFAILGPEEEPTKPFEESVSCKFGAPMGRGPYTQPTGRVHLQRVPMVDGDYDKGGAYWGGGTPLFCAWNDEGAAYVRAHSRDEAKRMFPGCTFYR